MIHDPALDDRRPDLFDLRRRYRFPVDTLANLAGVPKEVILAMLRFQPVLPGIAQRVLSTVEALYGREYNLITVKVNLIKEIEAASIGKQL